MPAAHNNFSSKILSFFGEGGGVEILQKCLYLEEPSSEQELALILHTASFLQLLMVRVSLTVMFDRPEYDIGLSE